MRQRTVRFGTQVSGADERLQDLGLKVCSKPHFHSNNLHTKQGFQDLLSRSERKQRTKGNFQDPLSKSEGKQGTKGSFQDLLSKSEGEDWKMKGCGSNNA